MKIELNILALGLFCLVSTGIHAQTIKGSDLLEKAIAFHDPNNQWTKFAGQFSVTMQTPNSSDRHSKILLNLPQQLFVLDVQKDASTYQFYLKKDSCNITLNGKAPSTAEAKEYRLSCDRGGMYRDYYTYLYGLPMKLRDPGTIIHEKVEKRNFKGKEYLILKATYEKTVGEDTWYFYFDPNTYAMEVYQFFHDESKNDGEYILLDDMEDVNGIKMPKVRKWYYNKDDKYLGADILN